MRLLRVEKRLRALGEKERSIRSPLFDENANVNVRKTTLDQMTAITIMMYGYILGIKDASGESIGEYYEQFFNQARSRQGFAVDPKRPEDFFDSTEEEPRGEIASKNFFEDLLSNEKPSEPE